MITTHALKHWREEQAFIREVRRDLAMPRYLTNKCLIAERDRPALQSAKKTRYLVMPKRKGKSGLRLYYAYEAYCTIKGQPVLTIDPRPRSPYVIIRLDLSTMAPFGSWNLYQPELDREDFRFKMVARAAGYHLVGPERAILFRVRHDQAEWVARELLAWFDRCYARNLAEIDQIIQSEGA